MVVGMFTRSLSAAGARRGVYTHARLCLLPRTQTMLVSRTFATGPPKNDGKEAKDALDNAAKEAKGAASEAKGAAQDAAHGVKSAAQGTASTAKSAAQDASKDVHGAVKGAAKDAQGAARDAQGTVKDSAEKVRGAAKDAAKDTSQEAQGAAYEASRKAHSTVNEAKGAVHNAAQEAKGTANDAKKAADNAAEEAKSTTSEYAKHAQGAVNDAAKKAQGVASDVKSAVSGAVKAAQDALGSTAKEAEATARDAQGTAKEAATSAAQEVKGTANQATGAVHNAANAAKNAASDAAKPAPIPRGGLSLDLDTTSLIDQDALEAPAGSEGGKGRTNAKARREGTSSSDKSRNFVMRIMLVGSTLLAGYSVWMLGRDLDEHEREAFHGREGLDSFIGRLQLRIKDMREGLSKPVWDKLLPDPLPFPYSRPYTLVVDLDQLLVSSTWSTATGWRTAKRPGLDYFLGYLSQWYEIVLFTTQPFYVVEKVVEKLDPDRRYIAYQLFRESCRMHDGKLVKDVSHLNRDPRKVIVLDTNPDHVSLQPENGLVLEPWLGNKDDRDLLGLVPFLDAIGIYGVDDVRTTLKAYQGKHIPSEYAKNEQLLKERHEEEWRAKKERMGGLSSLFGGITGTTLSKEPPKTMIEQERARYQQGYLEDQKFWKENGEKLRKQMQEEQEKQLRDMKLNAWDGVTRMFGGGPPPPPPSDSPSA